MNIGAFDDGHYDEIVLEKLNVKIQKMMTQA